MVRFSSSYGYLWRRVEASVGTSFVSILEVCRIYQEMRGRYNYVEMELPKKLGVMGGN